MTSSTHFLQRKLLINTLLAKKGRTGLAQGFTLIELMIVVAIIGILSAVAIPQFLGVRDRAAASAKVGELVGLAKECAVGQVTGATQALALGDSGITGATECDGTADVNLAIAALDPGAPAGVKCLSAESVGGESVATVTILQDGSMSCAWSS